MTVRYVLGFLFDPDYTHVAMIKKLKGPPAVVGKWNGVGGHIEDSDFNSYEAMSREFVEETGLNIPHYDWEKFAIIEGITWSMSCFRAVNGNVFKARTMEKEPVEVLAIKELINRAYNVVNNVPILLTLALDSSGLALPIALYDKSA